jgi:hypothetical protein
MLSAQMKCFVHRRWTVALLALVFVPVLLAQNATKVTAVEPDSGKVNDTLTLTGENIDKDNVVGVFLSDDKDDFKAAVVEQSPTKIVVKVPQTKPGGYNVSIQVKDRILILPLKFSVTE